MPSVPGSISFLAIDIIRSLAFQGLDYLCLYNLCQVAIENRVCHH
jgi:hypothetical protein